MKKYLMFLASAALVFAVSCNKIEETDTTVASGVETELITVELNPMTKTALGEEGATTWSAGDAVSVTVGGIHIGDLTLVEGSTFSGEVEAGKSGEALLHYPSGVTAVPATQGAVEGSFANGAALLDATTTMEALRSGDPVVLQNSTALLKFSVAQAGDVTFEVGDNDYTVTGCETGKTYYACVAPAEGVSFVARIGGYLSKQASANVTFAANEYAELGALPAPEAAKYGVIGSFQGWSTTSTTPMYVDVNNTVLAKSVKLYKDDEYKIYGLSDAAWYGKDDANVKVDKNGLFDITFNTTTKAITATCVEEYTDLMVTITVDNKANWSPLYIYLKDGDAVITGETGDLVTGNKYQISGDYIGSSLSYKFISDSKESEPANVTITKNGATVTLEETVIKLRVTLDTDNSKQYWGETMKIHVWNTGTSFDTTWPGTTMTSEGNYTWSVIVPSELVGKTINYLVHNGGGWQSKDSKITISAEGNAVTGSSIGIN